MKNEVSPTILKGMLVGEPSDRSQLGSEVGKESFYLPYYSIIRG